MRINLTKQEIVNSIYMQIGYSKNVAENLLEDFFDIIFKNLKENKKIKIAKFGTFELRLKKSRIGRNPKTKEVKTISTEEAHQMLSENKCNLIDIRDVRELQKEGQVEGANHIPRGMLEFWLDPESVYFKEGKLDLNKEMVLFCAGGLRSALAAKTLKDMGFEKVSHIDGGFGAIKQSKFKVI